MPLATPLAMLLAMPLAMPSGTPLGMPSGTPLAMSLAMPLTMPLAMSLPMPLTAPSRILVILWRKKKKKINLPKIVAYLTLLGPKYTWDCL